MRFTTRDLLWLTVVVALGLGWWIDRSQIIRDFQIAIDRANKETTKWFERAKEAESLQNMPPN
jgi:hypothetical protein